MRVQARAVVPTVARDKNVERVARIRLDVHRDDSTADHRLCLKDSHRQRLCWLLQRVVFILQMLPNVGDVHVNMWVKVDLQISREGFALELPVVVEQQQEVKEGLGSAVARYVEGDPPPFIAHTVAIL